MNALVSSAILGVVMMFSGILLKRPGTIRNVAVAGLLFLLVSNILDMYGTRFFSIPLGDFLHFDRFAILFNSVAIFCVLIYVLLTGKAIEKVGANYADYFALFFFILCGMFLVTSFQSLLILFLGIEIITIPLYILTGSDKRNLKSNEASLKYFLMGAFSTGLMLMGIALIYGAQGTFAIAKFDLLKTPGSPLMIAGILLMLFSMAFKVSAAPLHFWTPDVYDGAPTVFTSFMATVVKAAVFIGFIRLFENAFGLMQTTWQLWVGLMAAATLFIGNVTAVFQQSVKRMLAYSSIAQAGFMMLAIFALNGDAKEGLLLYGAAYSLATIGIFSVLSRMDDYSYESFNGLAARQPLVAAALTIFLLSLAGIPLTAGFLAKFYMIKAVVATGSNLWLVIFALLMAAISVYYYFRVIQAMYFREANAQTTPLAETGAGFKWLLVLVAGLVILLGLFPNLLLNWLYF